MANKGVRLEFKHLGYLKGHNDWVTSIVTGQNEGQPVLVVSSSRDKSILLWNIGDESKDDLIGQPRKMLTGHSHFISDLALTNDNRHLISSSWDKELRLWDLQNGVCEKRFVGHDKEVFTVAFSPDNRQIISSGAEREIKLFNTLGDCKFTTEKNNHTDWVSMVRFSPIPKTTKVNFQPYFVTVGWDGWLKIYNTNFTIRYQFKAHESNINAVAISPNGQYISTGGKDRKLHIWDISDLTKPYREFDAGGIVNSIAFSPLLKVVAVATENEVRVFDFNQEDKQAIAQLDNPQLDKEKKKNVYPTTITWDKSDDKVYAGYSNGLISVWEVSEDSKN